MGSMHKQRNGNDAVVLCCHEQTVQLLLCVEALNKPKQRNWMELLGMRVAGLSKPRDKHPNPQPE